MVSCVIFALDERSEFSELLVSAVVSLFAFFVEFDKIFQSFLVSLNLFLQELKFVGDILIHLCISLMMK